MLDSSHAIFIHSLCVATRHAVTGGYNSEMKGSRGNGRSQESSGEQGAPKEIKGLVR